MEIKAYLLAFAVLAVVPAQAQTEKVLHNFPGFSNGSHPHGDLIRDQAGNFYGTASSGGKGNGVVFKLDPTGNETVLHSFAAGTDGSKPTAGLVMDSAGNLYGTTEHGGTASWGVVFKVDPAGHETVLHTFQGGADGIFPFAGLILDAAGNLYGTTVSGGTGGWGTVFKLDPAGNETVLYSFTGGADGAYPEAGVIMDPAGNLYGTTYNGGQYNFGVVFKLDAAGHQTVLWAFTNGHDGARPQGGLALDSAGNLYGTTYYAGQHVAGVVFKLDPAGNETVLHNFGIGDGRFPAADVMLDSAGNLYGTTQSGGAHNNGTVYKVDTNGQETILYSFLGGTAGGSNPEGGVYLDAAGNLYGTATSGGVVGAGTVYKLDAAGNETSLCSFTVAGGKSPGALVRDPSGNLYGTAEGGTAGLGVVFELTSAGRFKVLHNFTGGADGAYPGGIIRDSAGNLYGNTFYGGPADRGVVFKIDPAGQETVLYAFTGNRDGSDPQGALALDSAGNLYGTTFGGGPAYQGVVYKLDPSGNETVLYSFTGGSDGGNPRNGVVLDSSGNLYGATVYGGASGYGVVFEVTPAGHETVLYTFTGGADGRYGGALLRDPNGNILGVTSQGDQATGVIYKLDRAGRESVLYAFTGGADGNGPISIVTDRAGNLYGSTYQGGKGGGTVYKLDAASNFTILYSFKGQHDGGNPVAVVLDPAGDVFGAASSGGSQGAGVIFKIQP